MKRTPLKRKTRLRPMSDKRRVQSREYSTLREQFLFAHPVCQFWCWMNGYEEKDGLYWRKADANKVKLSGNDMLSLGAEMSCDIHHKAKRGANYLNTETWMAVSRGAHEYIHNRPSWARENGFLI